MTVSVHLCCLSAGDVDFRFIDFLRNLPSSGDTVVNSSQVTVCDINQAMLDVGKSKAALRGRGQSTLFASVCFCCLTVNSSVISILKKNSISILIPFFPVP